MGSLQKELLEGSHPGLGDGVQVRRGSLVDEVWGKTGVRGQAFILGHAPLGKCRSVLGLSFLGCKMQSSVSRHL